MDSFKSCREKSGMTQKEIAYRLKVSVQAVSYWETGERMPSYEKLFELADAYQVSIDTLLGRQDRETRAAKYISGLTETEARLLDDFRSLSREGKDYILQTMAMTTNIYKNPDFSVAEDKIG